MENLQDRILQGSGSARVQQLPVSIGNLSRNVAADPIRSTPTSPYNLLNHTNYALVDFRGLPIAAKAAGQAYFARPTSG